MSKLPVLTAREVIRIATTDAERETDTLPMPDELWARPSGAELITPEIADKLFTSSYAATGRSLCYSREIAVNAPYSGYCRATAESFSR